LLAAAKEMMEVVSSLRYYAENAPHPTPTLTMYEIIAANQTKVHRRHFRTFLNFQSALLNEGVLPRHIPALLAREDERARKAYEHARVLYGDLLDEVVRKASVFVNECKEIGALSPPPPPPPPPPPQLPRL
jgi:hypothetical protein